SVIARWRRFWYGECRECHMPMSYQSGEKQCIACWRLECQRRREKQQAALDRLRANGEACEDCAKEPIAWRCNEHQEKLCWNCAVNHIDSYNAELEELVDNADQTVLERHFTEVD